jgi:membrane protein YdbS with pleckstrin-like domain
MSRRLVMREGEVRIISVTPVARRLWRPLLATFAATALVVVGASHVHFVHQHETLLGVLLVGPFALVALTRAWRWRSHKIHVTSLRVVLEGGVLHHHRSSVELRDVVATRVDQRISERLTRKGIVLLETTAGPVVIDQVRHPAALCRLIDAERAGPPSDSLPLDTVFTFVEPDPFDYKVRPRRRPSRGRSE